MAMKSCPGFKQSGYSGSNKQKVCENCIYRSDPYCGPIKPKEVEK